MQKQKGKNKTHNHCTEHGNDAMSTGERVFTMAQKTGGIVVATMMGADYLLELHRWEHYNAKDSGGCVTLRAGGAVSAETFARAKVNQITDDPMGFVMAVSNNITAGLATHPVKVAKGSHDALQAICELVERDLTLYSTKSLKPVAGTVRVNDDGSGLLYESVGKGIRPVKLSGLYRTVTTVFGPVLYLSEAAQALLSVKYGETSTHSGEALPDKCKTTNPARWLIDTDMTEVRSVEASHNEAMSYVAAVPMLSAIGRAFLDVGGIGEQYVTRCNAETYKTVHDYILPADYLD